MTPKDPKKISFDMRGQVCPSTLLTALKEINDHREALLKGEVFLSFRTDNRDATVTIPESASNMGYASTVRKAEGSYIIDVRREEGGELP